MKIEPTAAIMPPIRQLILQNKDSGTIKRAAQTHGMKTLREDGAQKVLRGITTIEELISTTQEDI